MDSLPIILLCLTAPCGLFLLVVAGIAWIDPLTYTDFFAEAQEVLGIKPPVIDAKESLMAHRIAALLGLLLCSLGCLYGASMLFFPR